MATAPSRVDRLLFGIFVATYGVMLIVGAIYVVPLAGVYPGRVLLPFVVTILLFALIALVPANVVRPALSPLPRRVTGLLGWVALIGVLAFAHRVPSSYASVLFLVLGPALLAFAWARLAGQPQPLLAALPPLLIAIALFVSEIPFRTPDLPRGRWGQSSTFATVFPTKPPFIGPGGRLRGDLDVTMSSREHLQGVRLITTAEGFRNAEPVAREPEPGETRILSLGDSFSIGMQIDQTEFFGERLESFLRRELAPAAITVLNAEISDPAYGLYYLQNHGVDYRPSVVLLGLCGNDMMQAEQFYGPGKLFQLDGSGRLVANPDRAKGRGSVFRHRDLVYPAVSELALAGGRTSPFARWSRRTADKWGRSAGKIVGRLLRFHAIETLTARLPRPQGRPTPMHSYAEEYEQADGHKRLIDGGANLGYFSVQPTPAMDVMYQRLFELLEAMDRTAKAHGGRLVLVLHPQRYQVNDEDWTVIRDYWALEEDDFDLRLYNRRLASFCAERDILCCDLLDAFIAGAASRPMYMPRGDMHFNSAGHAVAAETVGRFLRSTVLATPATE